MAGGGTIGVIGALGFVGFCASRFFSDRAASSSCAFVSRACSRVGTLPDYGCTPRGKPTPRIAEVVGDAHVSIAGGLP